MGKGQILFQILLMLLSFNLGFSQKASTSNTAQCSDFKIKPSATDSTITATDVAHWVRYDSIVSNNKIFLFLPGTNGIPERGPKKLFDAAIEHGYKVINLSYINKPAVAGICRGENLVNDSKCAEKFRTQRVFGTQVTPLIPDEAQDAIIPRFTKLLQFLVEYDKNGNWETYLEEGVPNWNKIVVSGQSQGGGMSAFIAKKKLVHRVVSFSGGWDYSAKGMIADWYAYESVTPADRWYATYHSKEPKAKTIEQTVQAMGIPAEHIYALQKEVREGKRAHGEAIRNTKYKELWKTLLKTEN